MNKMESTQHLTEFIFGDDAGEFTGGKIRIVDERPRRVSIYDVFLIMGDTSPPKTLQRLKERYPEVIDVCHHYKFEGQGQKNTNVTDAKGLVLLLMLLPGRKAADFRLKAAKILVRYLGGDITLIPEIENINQMQMHKSDVFGFSDLVLNITSLDQKLQSTSEFINPPINDQLLPPNIVYIMWIGYDHERDINVYKYGETTDLKTRSIGHKTEQKSQNYVLQVVLGNHSTSNFQNIVASIVNEKRIKLNTGSKNYNKEVFVCRNHGELQDIIGQIIKICNGDYYKNVVKDIRVMDGLIDPVALKTYHLERLKFQYQLMIAHAEKEVDHAKQVQVYENVLKDEDIQNMSIDEHMYDCEDIVSEIIDDEDDIAKECHLQPFLPTYPYDAIESVETLDEFLDKYCELGEDKKVCQSKLYEAYTTYISSQGFLGRRTFYAKIRDIKTITTSTTVPTLLHGVTLKPGVINDAHILIRDFLHQKCEFQPQYRVSSTDIYESFIEFVKSDIKLTASQMRTMSIHQVNLNSILKSCYPYKYGYISQHTQGYFGIKLKSQIIQEISELVLQFINDHIEKVPGERINRRPVYKKFLKWFEEKYKDNAETRGWNSATLREEMKKHFPFKNYKWCDLKLKD